MDKSVTIGVRAVLVTAVVLLALLAAYLLGGAGDGQASATRADNADGAEGATTPRTMTGRTR